MGQEGQNFLPRISLTDAIRPPLGWRLGWGVIGTYSADVAAIAAALLSITGRANEQASGSRTDLIDAVEDSRGKFRVVLQAGRCSLARRPRPIMAVFDQFLREVTFDEARKSWHPKMAVLRFSMQEGPTDSRTDTWRLYVGSKNLTKANSLEAGVALEGTLSGKGKPLEGLVEATRILLEHADLAISSPGQELRDLSQVHWTAPRGTKLLEIRLTPGDGAGMADLLPQEADRLVVISPFLRTDFLTRLGRVIEKRRADEQSCELVSTFQELQRVAAESAALGGMFGFSPALFYEEPFGEWPAVTAIQTDPNRAETDGANQAGSSGEPEEAKELDEEDLQLGLHAKLIYWRRRAHRELLIGSANASDRAWCGRNAEAVVRLKVDDNFEKMLQASIIDRAKIFEHTPTAEPLDVDDVDKAIEKARNQVCHGLHLRMVRVGDNHYSLLSVKPPNPTNSRIELSVGLLVGAFKVWPRGAIRLDLGACHKSELSDLVKVRIRLGDRGCEWLQKVVLEGLNVVDRDHAAFARYLDPESFLKWIKMLLADRIFASPDWDENLNLDGDYRNGMARQDGSYEILFPTVEDALKCWARSPDVFRRVDKRVRDYVGAMIERAADLSDENQQRLREFSKLWSTLGRQLRGR